MSESRRERREAERAAKRRTLDAGTPEAAAPAAAPAPAAVTGTPVNEPVEPQSDASETGDARGTAGSPVESAPVASRGTGAEAAAPAGETTGETTGESTPDLPAANHPASLPAQSPAAKTPVVPAPETAGPAAPARGKDRASRKALGMVGSAAVLCLGAAAIAAGSFFPPELPAQGAVTELTTLPAGDTLATCPASVRLLKGAGAELDPQFAPASKDSKSAVRAAVLSDAAGRIPGAQLLKLNGSVIKELSPRMEEAEAAALTGAAADGFSQRKATVVGGISEAEALSLRTQPLGGLQSLGGATRFYLAKDGDLAGLAAAGCSAPVAESWITGASTTGGTTSILHLANSSASVTQIDIDLRGAEGIIDAPSLDTIAIAPGEAKSFVLAAYAPDEKSLSLKVSASGGKVNASIQQSTLRGLTPGGVDFLVAGAPAANHQVIPGVVLQDPKLAGELSQPAENADAIAELHVAATSTEGATVKVRALGPDGEVPIPGGGELVIASNATARMPLTGLPAGNYTLVLEADSAVSAGVKMLRGTKANEAMDMAWAVGASRIGDEHLVPLPEFGAARLVLNAPADAASISVRPVGTDGKLGAEKKIELAGSKTVVLKASDLGGTVAAVVLSASGAPAYAATVIEDGAVGIAAVPLGAAPVGRAGVQVQLRH